MLTLRTRARQALLAAACTVAVAAPASAAPQPAAPTAVASTVTTVVSSLATAQAVPAAPLAAKKATKVTFNVSDTKVRKGERIWFAGRVTASPKSGRKVVIERRKAGGSWKSYTTTKTRSNGKFRGTVRPTAVYEYRARVTAKGASPAATSATRKVAFSTGKRNLTQRAQMIGSARLGKATTKVKVLSAKQRKATKVKGATTIKHQRFAKGLLVSVTKSGSTRTWLVTGKILKKYLAAGGPTGKLGVPVVDAKCGLIESGCVQRFSRGTIYSSSWKSKASWTPVTGSKGEVIAAARSQVGFRYRYATPGVQHTKYNSWMGSTRAWCSFFQSWASAASGNGSTIPKANSFQKFRSQVGKTMKTGKTPKVGALVFFNTVPPAGTPTHVGLVIAVSGSTITVVDGNTVGPLPAGYRGVLERTWPRSRALYYAYPSY